MRFVRIFVGALIGLAVMEVFAQNEPQAAARLPSATPATTNLFTTNSVQSTNLFAITNGTPRSVGLMESIRLALTNNFDVRIEGFNPQLAREDIEAAKGAYDPVISAGGDRTHAKDARGVYADEDSVRVGLNGSLPTGTAYNLGLNAAEFLTTTNSAGFSRRSTGKATVASVTQPLLRNFWMNPTRYNIAISRKQLKVSELAFRFRVLQIVSSVEQAYFEWIAARENVKVQEEAVSLARVAANEASQKSTIGVLTPLDQQKFESQAATSEAALLTARRNLREAEITLVNLITTQYESWKGMALEPADALPTQPREFDMQTSWTQAFAHRPDLHELIVNLEKLGLTEKLNYNQIFPTLNLTGAYGYDASGGSYGRSFGQLGDMNRPFWSLGIDASIPIGNRTARANLRATRLEKDQANERLKQARQTIMTQVENAIADARTAWERIAQTQKAREYAAAALAAEQTRFSAGAVKSFDVLQAQRDLTAARSDEIRTLVDYNKAVTVLLEREGTLLDERGLTVNIQ